MLVGLIGLYSSGYDRYFFLLVFHIKKKSE